MKAAAYIAGLLGLALLTGLVLHADVPVIVHTWKVAGYPLLWLIPYRLIFFALYAVGRSMARQPTAYSKKKNIRYGISHSSG